MHPFLGVFNYGRGGVSVALIAATGYLLVRAFPARLPTSSGLRPLTAIALAWVLAAFILTTWYLFSPTYIDHIEASVASITQYFRQGAPVYPDLDAYTFHGLLYGPLLAEVDSVGYLLGSGIFGSKVVGWLAAWTAMALILARAIRGAADWTGFAGVTCLLLVLASFGSLLISNRADSLLLLCAVLAWTIVTRLPGLGGLALASFLAGASADLKLHGPLYIVPALYLWASAKPSRQHAEWYRAAGVSAVTGLAGLALPFLPGNVHLEGYLSYLRLATSHGLSLTVFGANLAFATILWTPILLLWTVASPTAETARRLRGFVATLLLAESAVVVIASKPGAGVHHLLPFVAFHAALIQTLSTSVPDRPAERARASGMTALALAAVILGTLWSTGRALWVVLAFDRQMPRQEQARAELLAFASRYPHGMLGTAGDESFRLTNFRPWLTLQGTPQTDYGALMDLKLSGVSDAPLAAAFAQCHIPYVFVPRPGGAFTLHNIYTGAPLFSEAVQNTFATHYVIRESGNDFDVFACRASAPSP